MKIKFVISLLCICFYSHSFTFDTWDNENKIRDIERKQRCLERNQREMQDYVDCKDRESSLRSLNPNGFRVSTCIKPINSYCY